MKKFISLLLELGGFVFFIIRVGVIFFVFCCLLTFFNIFYIFSTPYTMCPEFILVFTIILAVLFYGFANIKYGIGFFHKQFVLAFGYQSLVKLSNFGTFEYNVLMRFHNSRKQLTTILIFWRTLFVGSFIAFSWFVYQFGFFYPINLFAVNFSNLDFTTVSYLVSGTGDIVFGSHFYHDGFTFNSRFFLLFLFILFLIMARNELFQESKLCNLEFLVLYAFGTLFCMLLVSSFSLVSFFLSAEGLVITMYLLAASGIYYRVFSKLNLVGLQSLVRYRSLEGALKYSVFNILSTFFLLFGSLILFAFTRGSLFFSTISIEISRVLHYTTVPSIFLFSLFFGVLCLCLSFFFKLGLFPFSFWVPDLYESTIPLNMVFFLLLPKAAIMLSFINMYRFFFAQFYMSFFVLCATLGFLSILFGSLGAINQVKISRIMAYSSVTYAGLFIFLTAICFLPLVKLSHLPVVFVIVYIFVLLFFLVIFLALRYSPYYFTYAYVTQFRFAQTRSKTFQLFLVNSLFSLSGIPPFFGWLLKFIFLIALIKLFSFSLFDFFKISSWVPIDLLINFFQQYDTRWVTTGTFTVQQTIYDQLLIIQTGSSFGSCVIGEQSFNILYPSLTTGHSTVVSVGAQKTNASGLFFDFVSAFVLFAKNGFSYIFSTSAVLDNLTTESFCTQIIRLLLFNDISVVTSYLISPNWFTIIVFFILTFTLFLLTVISTFYYLRILKSVYNAPKHSFMYYNQNTGAINISFSMCALALFLGVINFLGVFFFQFTNNVIFLLFCFNSVGF